MTLQCIYQLMDQTMDLLWVNHEYSSDLFVQGDQMQMVNIHQNQIEKMLYVQGGSIIEVKGDEKGGWKMDTDF